MSQIYAKCTYKSLRGQIKQTGHGTFITSSDAKELYLFCIENAITTDKLKKIFFSVQT